MVNRQFHTDFTEEELDGTLRRSKKGKAPGRDSVTQEMLTNMGPKTKNALLRLYNRSWHSRATPPVWRTAVVVPILKKGKKASDLAKLQADFPYVSYQQNHGMYGLRQTVPFRGR